LSEPLALEVSGLRGPSGAPLISNIDLRVPRRATHLVMGPIHAGKSMLMRHIVGLERAEAGTIAIDGEVFDTAVATESVLRRMRMRVGVVFEGSALVSRLSAVENVELPLLEHTGSSPEEAREAAQELLSDVAPGIDGEATPSELRRGEQRVVALARALALRPPVLLMDEPTAGLDSHTARLVDDTVARLQHEFGFGILLFSHEVRHAFGRAEQISVMDNGLIVAQGDRAALLASSHPVVAQLMHRRGAR
jgi:ABC-type transporter Mla maintaining outer membrane lipid asymmetry ATPase subunit MlaF